MTARPTGVDSAERATELLGAAWCVVRIEQAEHRAGDPSDSALQAARPVPVRGRDVEGVLRSLPVA